jgi:hypothetical protein
LIDFPSITQIVFDTDPLLAVVKLEFLSKHAPTFSLSFGFFLLKPGMRFLRRHRYTLGFLAVLVLCSLLVQWQFLRNQSAHVRMREDFILLNQHGHVKPSERFYQLLIHSLPEESDKSLLDDFLRTAMLVDTNKPQTENLVWKYHISVRNEINRRAEKRIARLLNESRQ